MWPNPTSITPLTQLFKNQGMCIEFADEHTEFAGLGITKDTCKNAFKTSNNTNPFPPFFT